MYFDCKAKTHCTLMALSLTRRTGCDLGLTSLWERQTITMTSLRLDQSGLSDRRGMERRKDNGRKGKVWIEGVCKRLKRGEAWWSLRAHQTLNDRTHLAPIEGYTPRFAVCLSMSAFLNFSVH